MCLQWACCPIPDAVCCDDHVHCCPQDLPICDVEHGRCRPKGLPQQQRLGASTQQDGMAGAHVAHEDAGAHAVWRGGLLGATESSAPIMKKLPAEQRRAGADEVLQQAQ